jgi:hypothetical protein
MFGTKFISTKTLAGASVPRSALQRLSRRLAERYQVVPLRFAEDDTLTIAYCDPSDSSLLENVRVAAGAREVRGLVARPAAILAAIGKLYAGDPSTFNRLGGRSDDAPASRPVPITGAEPRPAANPSSQPPSSFESEPLAELPVDTSAFDGPGYPGDAYASDYAADPYPTDAPAEDPAAIDPLLAEPFRAGRGIAAPAAPPPSSPGALSTANWLPPSELPPELDAGTAAYRATALGDASRLAECLMVIHERSRGSLKSHSVRVARLSYALCRQLDLSESQAAHAWAIGLFHDLGKTQQHHLTALTVWQLRDHYAAARAQYKNPGRLLKNADVPDTVTTAILHMYERFDGQGFPDAQSGEAIPFQSRVLALCDSIADLTLNPDNTLGRIVSPIEACNHLRAQSPKVFDPTLLAHFSRLVVERKLDGVFLTSEQSMHGIEKLLG